MEACLYLRRLRSMLLNSSRARMSHPLPRKPRSCHRERRRNRSKQSRCFQGSSNVDLRVSSEGLCRGL